MFLKPSDAAMSTSAGEAGFTLLEVIVAFAIAALSVGVLFETFGGGIAQIRETRTRAEAALVARSVLANAERMLAKSDATNRSGRNGAFAWTIKTRGHAQFAASTWATAIVSWPADRPSSQRKRISVTTLLPVARAGLAK